LKISIEEKINPDAIELETDVVIIGAGPAGLTAAYQLSKAGKQTVVFEKGPVVGGIARTENYKGYGVDIGGHRFFTKVTEVEEMWREVLGDDLLHRTRLSRIYYNNKFFYYPIRFFDALLKLGLLESVRIGLSYGWARLRPNPKEETLEEWVSNRFGKRLYQIFFKTYTEKVWGIPCTEIKAEWAAQRIKGLSLTTAVKNALFNSEGQSVKTLIDAFDYPRRGPGMLWQRVRELIEVQNHRVFLEAPWRLPRCHPSTRYPHKCPRCSRGRSPCPPSRGASRARARRCTSAPGAGTRTGRGSGAGPRSAR
jgi:protoporphyrinogen oxidase